MGWILCGNVKDRKRPSGFLTGEILRYLVLFYVHCVYWKALQFIPNKCIIKACYIIYKMSSS